MKMMMNNANHPEHYNKGRFEVIDVIDDWGCDFCTGNAIKYIARAPHKDHPVTDLEKAIWYLQHKIDLLKANAAKCIRPSVGGVIDATINSIGGPNE
jgi:hypothetical protein